MTWMRWVSFVAATFATVVLLGGWQGSQAAQPTVTLTTVPPLEQVIPFQDSVHLDLQATDASGNPVNDARMVLQLLTPPRTPWLSSDFPWVEGTTLLALDAIAPQGHLDFEQVMPIRGTYTLNLEVEPMTSGDFQPFTQSLTLSVPENPLKYRNVAILLVILLLGGFIGGWFIGGQPTPVEGEIAPQRVRLLLSGAIVVAIAALLVVNFSARSASAHPEGHHEPLAIPSSNQGQSVTARLSGHTQARVGQLAQQTLTLETPGNPADVQLHIRTLALENHQPIFTYRTIPLADGQLTWQQQFFDGAPHQVVVEVTPREGAMPNFEPFQVAQAIDVMGLEPPLSVRLITLSYFTLSFVLGLCAGLGAQRKSP